jgi:hypothetical protein
MRKVEINGKTLHLSPNFELPEGVSLEELVIIPNSQTNKYLNGGVEVDELKVYNPMDKPEALDTLEYFATILAEKIGITPNDWFPRVSYHSSNVWNISKNKMYYEEKEQLHIMSYEDECFRLEISEVSADCVELLWLKVNDKCKGKGTEIVNNVLNTADEMGIKVKVLPVDFQPNLIGNQKTSMDYLKWLRDWYRSFEFKSYSNFTPALMYYPSK